MKNIVSQKTYNTRRCLYYLFYRSQNCLRKEHRQQNDENDEKQMKKVHVEEACRCTSSSANDDMHDIFDENIGLVTENSCVPGGEKKLHKPKTPLKLDEVRRRNFTNIGLKLTEILTKIPLFLMMLRKRTL